MKKEEKDVHSPAPRRRPSETKLEKMPSLDKDPNRKGMKGSMKRKSERQASIERAEGEMISVSVEKMRRMEQKEEIYKAKIEELTTRSGDTLVSWLIN